MMFRQKAPVFPPGHLSTNVIATLSLKIAAGQHLPTGGLQQSIENENLQALE